MKFQIYRHDTFWEQDFEHEVKEFGDADQAWEYCRSLYTSGGYGYHAKPLTDVHKEKLSKEAYLRAQLEEIERIKQSTVDDNRTADERYRQEMGMNMIEGQGR